VWCLPGPDTFRTVQWYMDPYAKNPYSMQWNFGFAKQINDSTTVNLDYVGSGSPRLDAGWLYNVGSPRARPIPLRVSLTPTSTHLL